MRRLNVEFPDEEYKRLKIWCARREQSISEAVRAVMAAKVRETEAALAAFVAKAAKDKEPAHE